MLTQAPNYERELAVNICPRRFRIQRAQQIAESTKRNIPFGCKLVCIAKYIRRLWYIDDEVDLARIAQ